jgi:hypothetical protein
MLRSVLVLALIAFTFAQPTPQPMPSQFVAKFDETFIMTGQPSPAPSTGAWFYSATTNEWRADHYAPQTNNFCACAAQNTSDSCSLIFTHDGHMYVDFPNLPYCCHLCDSIFGCGVLQPSWISSSTNATFKGVYTDTDGRKCYNWCIPGFAAANDCWAFHDDQTPCMYSENFSFPGGSIAHNLTFTSFDVAAPPESMFVIRPQCNQMCPKIFPITCQ